MPGNISLADGLTVLPAALCSAFSRGWNYPVQVNDFPDGACLREIEATNSRRAWKQTRKVRAVALGVLRAFYDACGGPRDPFLFYDPFEVAEGDDIGSNHDPTGLSMVGRFTVRFNTDYSQNSGVAFSDVQLEFAELAALIAGAEELNFSQEQSSAHIVTTGV